MKTSNDGDLGEIKPKFLSIKQISVMFGFSYCKVRRMIKKHGIRGYKFDRLKRYEIHELLEHFREAD